MIWSAVAIVLAAWLVWALMVTVFVWYDLPEVNWRHLFLSEVPFTPYEEQQRVAQWLKNNPWLQFICDWSPHATLFAFVLYRRGWGHPTIGHPYNVKQRGPSIGLTLH